jgi:serine/threonine protein kinase
MRLAVGIARCLGYLGRMGFVHRDIKAQNVLVDDECEAVICYFGLSRKVGRHMITELGMVQWSAPEIMRPKSEYDCRVDTFAFGVILWELLTGQMPWPTLRVMQCAQMVLDQGERLPIPADAPSGYVALMTSCWSQRSDQRKPIETVRAGLESGRCSLAAPTHRSLRSGCGRHTRSTSGSGK